MWVTGTDYYGEIIAVNLDKVSFIDVGESYIRFTAERQSDDAVGQHTVQPVVPAEPDDDDPSDWDAVAVQDNPFRITGLGLYEMRTGVQQRVIRKDPDGDEPMWFVEAKGWYYTDGRWDVNNHANDIVKLIKLDEVQP